MPKGSRLKTFICIVANIFKVSGIVWSIFGPNEYVHGFRATIMANISLDSFILIVNSPAFYNSNSVSNHLFNYVRPAQLLQRIKRAGRPAHVHSESFSLFAKHRP